MIFGNWKVLYRAQDKNSGKKPVVMWHCKCLLCGEESDVSGSTLRQGTSTQCKKCFIKNRKPKKRKQEEYIEKGDYFIGILNNGEKFFIDKEDYNKVSKFHWIETKNNYLYSTNNKKRFYMHRFVMDEELKKQNIRMDIDHINHNKLDNRKKNLRVVNRSQNNMNRTPQNCYKTNGIYYSKILNKYVARITVYNQVIQLGSFTKIEEAIKARKEAEKIYFGEFSYESSMMNSNSKGEENEK